MVEKAALDQWYCLDHVDDVPQGDSANRLLGMDLEVQRGADIRATLSGRALPVAQRYGYLWVTPGEPARDLPAIPEAQEPDRRYVPCGAVAVRASGLRIVENFLDMAHFPFVHTGILGSEPHTEVASYDCEIRRDVDEVWATNCTFVQPKAALSAGSAVKVDYTYRVMTPFNVILYKTCPAEPSRQDVIGLFVQPVDAGRCRAHPVMFLIDDTSSQADLVGFQQVIFLQDRIILKNSARSCCRSNPARKSRHGRTPPRSPIAAGSRKRGWSTARRWAMPRERAKHRPKHGPNPLKGGGCPLHRLQTE